LNKYEITNAFQLSMVN